MNPCSAIVLCTATAQQHRTTFEAGAIQSKINNKKSEGKKLKKKKKKKKANILAKQAQITNKKNKQSKT